MVALTHILKRSEADNLLAAIDRVEPRLRRTFQIVVSAIRDEHSLAELTRLIEMGRVDEALSVVSAHIETFAAVHRDAFVEVGRETAAFVARQVKVQARFDEVNERAVRLMRENKLRLVREFTDEQRRATRAALIEGTRDGINPRAMARRFRESIGLTEYQTRVVANYRRELQTQDSAALARRLRDRRFDRATREAIESGKPLTKAQIDRMVQRYHERWLKYRSEVIARTEALRTVHEAAEEGYQQAIDSGVLEPDTLIRTWVSARDSRVRDSHRSMNGQKRKIGERFQTGNGWQLRYPGDPSAPSSEVIQCRCVLTTRMERGSPVRWPTRDDVTSEDVTVLMPGRRIRPQRFSAFGEPIEPTSPERMESIRDLFRLDRQNGGRGVLVAIARDSRGREVWDVIDGRHRLLVAPEFPSKELKITFTLGIDGDLASPIQ